MFGLLDVPRLVMPLVPFTPFVRGTSTICEESLGRDSPFAWGHILDVGEDGSKKS